MLLPYASDRPPRNPPIVVPTLVLFHFALFGVIALLSLRNGNALVVWYANLSLIPGALRWYAPLTYSFLHDGVFHLSSNMLFLWVFGASVEDAVGWKRFLALYLSAAILTGLLQAGMAWAIPGGDRMTPIVGASGAVAALVGVFTVRFYRSRIRFIGLPWSIPAVVLLALVLFGEMTTTLWHLYHRLHGTAAPTTAHWAHIGGFLLGMVWAQAARMVRAGRYEYLAEDARLEMERGSPLTAARRWEAVLQAQPDNLEAEAELGRAWAMAGDAEQAEKHYRRAIEGLRECGKRREAVERYREWRRFDANAVLAAPEQLAIAGALEKAKDYREAIATLESLISAHPDARESEVAALRMGFLWLERLGDPEKAAECLRSFLDRYPQSEWKAYAENLLRTARKE
jgi:membrane associated rhomboid family serine protease